MSYEKTFHLNNSMIAWPEGVGVKTLTVEELEDREVEARLAEIGCSLGCSETNEKLWSVQLDGVLIEADSSDAFQSAINDDYKCLWSESPSDGRKLWFSFGGSEGGFGAYLRNSLKSPIIIDSISIGSNEALTLEAHLVEGVGYGRILPKVIDPNEPDYIHHVRARSGNVRGIKEIYCINIHFIDAGIKTMPSMHNFTLNPGQAIALKSDKGFKCGAIEGTVVNETLWGVQLDEPSPATPYIKTTV